MLYFKIAANQKYRFSHEREQRHKNEAKENNEKCTVELFLLFKKSSE